MEGKKHLKGGSHTLSVTPWAEMAAGPRRRETSEAMKTQQPRTCGRAERGGG